MSCPRDSCTIRSFFPFPRQERTRRRCGAIHPPQRQRRCRGGRIVKRSRRPGGPPGGVPPTPYAGGAPATPAGSPGGVPPTSYAGGAPATPGRCRPFAPLPCQRHRHGESDSLQGGGRRRGPDCHGGLRPCAVARSCPGRGDPAHARTHDRSGADVPLRHGSAGPGEDPFLRRGNLRFPITAPPRFCGVFARGYKSLGCAFRFVSEGGHWHLTRHLRPYINQQ